MSEANDPIRTIERSRLRALALGSVACLALAAWALRPMHPVASLSKLAAHEPPLPPTDVTWTMPLAAGIEAFDSKLFEVQLWTAPPKPVEAVAPAPPAAPRPPPFNLQLVGIISNPASADAVALRAAFFDPETAKVYSAACGQSVLRYRVSSVTPEQVALTDEQHSAIHVLMMKSGDLKPATNIRVVKPKAASTPGTRGSN